MAKASEIIRELSGKIIVGDKVIDLIEETHKAILVALMNIATSTVGNSDAKASGKLIASFISDVKVSDLPNYTFEVTDQIKTATFRGDVLRTLVSVWGECEVEWHVVRGGKRSTAPAEVVKLGTLS